MIIDLKDIRLFFGAEEILKGITLKIEDSDKIGLIGANGAGKSTLLNIITGELSESEGEIARSQKTIGYLHQNSGLDGDSTIIEEMRSVFSELIRRGERLTRLYSEIAAISDHDSQEYNEKSNDYARLQTIFEQHDGYNIDIKINTVLNGMGFSGKDKDTSIKTLSGGEKTRLALCKLLLSEPDLLVLDEPTNHLDFKTLNWLEDYLRTYKGALLMVSHDRYFLDKLTTDICEIYKGRLSRYKGNYTKFVAQKESRLETMLKEYDKQQVEIAELKEYIAKNMARASTSNSAKSRQTKLEKMDILEKPTDYLKSIKMGFDFKTDPVLDVLAIENLHLKAGDKLLNESISLHIRKNDKIAIVGENGIGKTTLLRHLFTENASIKWGRNTKISYFEQEDAQLNENKTALNEVWDRFSATYEQDIRNALGRMLLTGEDVYKQIGVLSGGERAKVKFAIMMLEKANVLILDEPTNHLDLSSKEVLDKALAEFSGTIIMVSHDRYLLNKVPTKIVEMKNDEMVIYDGKYDYYLEKQQAASASVPKEVPADKKENTYFRSKKERAEEVKKANDLKKLEEKIAKTEEEISILESEIAEAATDFEILTQKCEELEQKKQELDVLYESWSEIN